VARRRTIKQRRRKHAERRLNERYGEAWTKELHDRIVARIQKGRAKCVRRTSNSRSVFDVELDNVTYRVVYHRPTKMISTFLYAEETESDS
jgi:hypothetical protein